MNKNILYQIKTLEKLVIRSLLEEKEIHCLPTPTQIQIIEYIQNQKEDVYQKDLEKNLNLRRATVSGVLKTMEKKGWVARNRSKEDERVLNVTITKQGEALKEQAVSVPEQMAGCVHLKQEEIAQLYQLLYKILDNL